ncbi:M14 family zinc carboxypeptidase [Arsukibacterium indicum]|uniref:PKD domain-containing protein n=1 Tax=Arsukibacterium indicum TaxID=2848612 RepID=A0ABS6MQ86_9GAMM|nr:M14 family zinc carboxypeptidase [Arsukibacterium indicum]MBV2130992.1 PKD domain-containing protein [Arsukibacterium indicum]
MTVISVLFSAVFTASVTAAAADPYQQVRLQLSGPEQHAKASISLHPYILATDSTALTIDARLPVTELAALANFGISWQLLPASAYPGQAIDSQRGSDSNVSASADTIAGYPCYHTVEGTYQQAAQLAADYPEVAQWVSIGSSWQHTQGEGGYPLMVLRLGRREPVADPADERPVLFVQSAMHAREYVTAELNLQFARQLLENYQQQADANWLLNFTEIHLLFHMNPDGRKFAEQGQLWRKNANLTHCPQDEPGVDLNRNFSYSWNISSNGSSGEACSTVYRGPQAGSEPETQAVENYIRQLYSDRRGVGFQDPAPADTAGLHLDLHSAGELVLWPWGHTNDPAPNASELQTLGRKLAWFNNYYPSQSIGLYPTDGTSDSVSYGELGVAAITLELGTGFFQGCQFFSNSLLPANLPLLNYAAKVSKAPYQLPTGPDITALNVNGISHAYIQAGDAVTLSVTADDQRFSQRNGREQAQTVVAARIYRHAPPWHSSSVELATAQLLHSNDNGSVASFQANLLSNNWPAGKQLLYVQAEDSDGNVGAVSAVFVTVGELRSPVADFTSQCTALSCTFNAAASSADSTITAYQWQLSDGSSFSGATVNHNFAGPGSYQVTLTITDSDQLTASSSKTVTVSTPPPPPPPPAVVEGSGGSNTLYSGLLLLLFVRRFFEKTNANI